MEAQVLSIVGSIVATGATTFGIAVKVFDWRLYKFKDELKAELNGTYTRAQECKLMHSNTEQRIVAIESDVREIREDVG